MDFLGYLNNYLYVIIFLKTLFVVTLIFHFYYKFESKRNPKNTTYKKNEAISENTKNNLGKIVSLLMSILIIILFNPLFNKKMNIMILKNKTKFLLFIYGFIILFSIDFSSLINNNNNNNNNVNLETSPLT